MSAVVRAVRLVEHGQEIRLHHPLCVRERHAPLFAFNLAEAPAADPWRRGALWPFTCQCIGQVRTDGTTLLRTGCQEHATLQRQLDGRRACPNCHADAMTSDPTGTHCRACGFYTYRARSLD